MIKIYLFDFNGAEADENCLSALPSYIEKTKNPRLRAERIFSYMLLSYAYEKSFSKQMPGIERDGYGRPYFVGSGIDFNISHDGNFVALAISDEGRVGIDIQLCKSDVSERLLKKADELYSESALEFYENTQISEKTKIEIVRQDKFGKLVNSTELYRLKDMEKNGFFYRWTRIEALAKADGRGISYVSKMSRERDDFLFESFSLIDSSGETYCLSLGARIQK